MDQPTLSMHPEYAVEVADVSLRFSWPGTWTVRVSWRRSGETSFSVAEARLEDPEHALDYAHHVLVGLLGLA